MAILPFSFLQTRLGKRISDLSITTVEDGLSSMRSITYFTRDTFLKAWEPGLNQIRTKFSAAYDLKNARDTP